MIKILQIIFIFVISFTKLLSEEINLAKLASGFNSPWSLSLIDDENILITEKSGNLILFNLNEKKRKK